MITEEKLVELRDHLKGTLYFNQSPNVHFLDDANEICDTLSALWRVAKAAEAVADAARTFDDRVANMEKLRKAIDSLREGKEIR